MKINSVIFIDSYPKLDLHGMDSITAEMLIKDFVKENSKLKKDFIVIVHGFGQGILKKTTHNVLSKSKYVKEYKIFFNNTGCTIVSLF